MLHAQLGCQRVGLRRKLSLQQQRVRGAGEVFSIRLRAELTRKLFKHKGYVRRKHMVALWQTLRIPSRSNINDVWTFRAKQSGQLLSASMLLQHGSISVASQQNKPSLQGLPQLYTHQTCRQKITLSRSKVTWHCYPGAHCEVLPKYSANSASSSIPPAGITLCCDAT